VCCAFFEIGKSYKRVQIGNLFIRLDSLVKVLKIAFTSEIDRNCNECRLNPKNIT